MSNRIASHFYEYYYLRIENFNRFKCVCWAEIVDRSDWNWYAAGAWVHASAHTDTFPDHHLAEQLTFRNKNKPIKSLNMWEMKILLLSEQMATLAFAFASNQQQVSSRLNQVICFWFSTSFFFSLSRASFDSVWLALFLIFLSFLSLYRYIFRK